MNAWRLPVGPTEIADSVGERGEPDRGLPQGRCVTWQSSDNDPCGNNGGNGGAIVLWLSGGKPGSTGD
eukprot:7201224-Alexandrium_andersonii.AAC.1